MDFGNNKKIVNSASRLKAPTPHMDSDDGDGLFLNKSVEIKKRSRNKNSKFLTKNTSMKTISQKKGLLNLNKKELQTSNSTQQFLSPKENKLFFKPYSSTSGGTSSGRKRYTASNQVQPPEILPQKAAKVEKPGKEEVKAVKDAQQQKNISQLIQNFQTQRKRLNSPVIQKSNQGESAKKKPDVSPNNKHKTSVVSGLSVISQLSFIKQSFSSPMANPDGSIQNRQQQNNASEQQEPLSQVNQ